MKLNLDFKLKLERKTHWKNILNWMQNLIIIGIACACSVISLVHQTDEIKIIFIKAHFTWDNHESRISWASGVILVKSSWHPLKSPSLIGSCSLRCVACSIRNHQIRNCHTHVEEVLLGDLIVPRKLIHISWTTALSRWGWGVAWLIKASLTRRNSLTCSSIVVPFLTCRQKLATILAHSLQQRWNV